MELVVGKTYKEITLVTEGLKGLERTTTLTNAIVLDEIHTENGKEYVFGAPPCAVPSDWVVSCKDEDEE